MDKFTTEIAQFIMFIAKLLGFGTKETTASIDNEIDVVFTPPVGTTNREKLYEFAYSKLGIDMAPTQDYLGCAESLSNILWKSGLVKLTGLFLSTVTLNAWCKKNLVEVTNPEFGDIIMSETGAGNGKIKGHCGIVGKHKIMSNNSQTSLWDDHWSMQDWKAYYGEYGGLPVRFYRIP